MTAEQDRIEADFVVIGAGSAGCAVAARLSEDPATRVLLLEAGGADRNRWIHIPLGFGNTFADPSVNFALEFAASSEPAPEKPAALPTALRAVPDEPPPKTGGAEVVALDKFRKR